MRISNTVVLDGEYVLLLHKKHRNWYVAPGGKCEEDETVEEGAIRELYEETNIEVSEVVKVSLAHVKNFDKSFDLHTFLATSHKGTLKKECHEGTNSWFHISTLDELPMNEGDRILIKNAVFNQKFIEVDLEFDESFEMINYEMR
jgi:8-oxo-dGTP diphosphatase